MAKLGELFEIGGTLIATIITENTPILWHGTSMKATVQPGSNNTLKLETVHTTNNRANNHRRAVESIHHELKQRRADILAIKQQIKILLKKAEEEDEDVTGDDLVQLSAIKGTHLKRVATLEAQRSVSVTYQRIQAGREVTLQPGVFISVPWLAKPLVWIPAAVGEEKEEEVLVSTDVTEDMPIEHYVEDRYIYVIGADNGQCSVKGERFDPCTTVWSDIPSMLTMRRRHGAIGLGGHLYIVGGTDGNDKNNCKALATVEKYDPATKMWSFVQPMTTPRDAPALVATNGTMYAVGGKDGTDRLASAERYDPKTNEWSRVCPMSTRRWCHAAAVVNECIYVMGGGHDGKIFDSVEKYDPDKDTWALMAPIPCKVFDMGVGVIGHHIYLVGGMTENSTRLNSVYRYDAETNTWDTVAPLSAVRNRPVIAVLHGFLYATGGQ